MASRVSSLEALHVLRQLIFSCQGLYGCGPRLPHFAGPRLLSLQVQPYQQGARSMTPSADGYGRPPRPQVDRREIRPHFCTRRAGARVRTRGAGKRAAEVELGGHEPLARSPRFEVSPSPSCPLMFQPQHLTVASSCGEIEDHCPVEN